MLNFMSTRGSNIQTLFTGALNSMVLQSFRRSSWERHCESCNSLDVGRTVDIDDDSNNNNDNDESDDDAYSDEDNEKTHATPITFIPTNYAHLWFTHHDIRVAIASLDGYFLGFLQWR